MQSFSKLKFKKKKQHNKNKQKKKLWQPLTSGYSSTCCSSGQGSSSASSSSPVAASSTYCKTASRATASHGDTCGYTLPCANKFTSLRANPGAGWHQSHCHRLIMSIVVDTDLSETELPSLLLLWLVLEALPLAVHAFLLGLQWLLHASEPQPAGPAWPGCCSSPGAASDSDAHY